MRNSVGVRSTVCPPHDASCVAGSRRRPPTSTDEIGAASLDQSAQARDELGERERLRQVVVAARGEAGQPVGEGVACRQEDHRRADSLRAKRLDDVAAVRVGQADVDDERVRIGIPDPAAAARLRSRRS